ncbi:MAG: tetratricopeptide repeat protein [Phycisphaerales bacterium]|nr:tetratricopeptide repeat protein [Phycisphaerales bacterium]
MSEASGQTKGSGPGEVTAGAEPAGVAAAPAPRSVNWKLLAAPVVLLAAGGLLTAGVVGAFRTKPRVDPGAPLRAARDLLEHQEYEQALELLNTRMVPMINAGTAGPAEHVETLQLVAMAVSQWQEQEGISRAENHEKIVASSLELEELGHELEAAETARLARSMIALGEIRQAAERIETLGADDSARQKLVRELVDTTLEDAELSRDHGKLVMEQLGKMLAEPALGISDRAWAVGRQAKLQLAAGANDEAISRLLRELQHLRGADDAVRAELHVLLAEAYLQTDEHSDAKVQLESSRSMLEATDPLRAKIGVLLGRIDEKNGRLEEAKEQYTGVVADHAKSNWYSPAQFGMARVEAALSNDEDSLQLFADVVEGAVTGHERTAGGGVEPDAVRESLMAVFADRVGTGDVARALQYAQLAERLYAEADVPADVLLALGQSQRRRAEQVLETARGGRRDLRWMDDVSPVTREEVKSLYLGAGAYFKRHAQRVQVEDVGGFAASMWESGDCYDLAGDLEAAEGVFSSYIAGATDEDPRRPEARYRLGRVFQAKRDYGSAQEQYEQLQRGREEGGSGPWADRSVVPLAQCYLRDADTNNDAEAERLLVSVVQGVSLAPEAAEFREGLVELGRLLYESGRYPEAISRLTEAVERYPEGPAAESQQYLLADSHRLSASQIEGELSEAMPPSQRSELEGQRRERLRSAIGLYERVLTTLESKDQARLSDLEQVQLRNCAFYIGDCAYDLGDFQAAIDAYDTARQKYSGDPASLVAMVQIVSAYIEQGEWAKAITANQRARQQLERLPEDVWDSPDLPMERKHWQRWLDASTILEQRAAAEARAKE